MRKRIEVGLTDEEYNFIKWMAKRDSENYGRAVSFQEEMQMIFNTELTN